MWPHTHLHEDFADDDVVVVFEHCAEHHRHSVFLGLQIPAATTSYVGFQRNDRNEVRNISIYFRYTLRPVLK